MDLTLKLDAKEYKDLTSFCNLNKFEQDEIVKKSYLQGFSIEKYGLLSGGGEVIEKEVIKEIVKYVEVPVVEEKVIVKVEYVEIEKPVEVIREVKIEVPVERIVEVVKEVIVEKIIEVSVTNLDNICDKNREEELLLKIQELENNFQDKMSKKEQELDELRQELDKQLDRPPIEKIVEVVVEKEITDNSSKSKLDALQNTLAKVRQETLEKDKKIRELEQTIQEIQKFQENKQAVYLKGSNLDDKLYK